ncbi:MAG TPA: hypothetical protein VJX93_02920 [Candidatus Methanomethylophilaceae archaeon]|nr:hypothetical protein [Candidatus Methanomethylophilaceae archaeon]
MSFFDNPKNFGIAAIVLGAVSLISGIVAIINGALADPMATGSVVVAVGTLIFGILILGVGIPVYKGEETNRLSILGLFVRVIGLATIATYLFNGIGQIIDESIAYGAAMIVIGIILGLILIWAAEKIVDGSVDTMDTIIWIILLVVFAILTIVSLVGIFTPFLSDGEILNQVLTAVLSLFTFILYAFLLVTVLSDDVKKAMGV